MYPYITMRQRGFVAFSLHAFIKYDCTYANIDVCMDLVYVCLSLLYKRTIIICAYHALVTF